MIEAFTGIPQSNSPQKWDVHITLPLLAGRALQQAALLWPMLPCLSLPGNSALLHFWSGLPEISSDPTNWLSFLKQKKVCAETCSFSGRSASSSFHKRAIYISFFKESAESSQFLLQPIPSAATKQRWCNETPPSVIISTNPAIGEL